MPAILHYGLWFLMGVVRLFLAPIARLCQWGKLKKCPPIKSALLLKSGKTLAAMIRKQEVTSEEIVSAFVERCRDVNVVLNAVVEDRYEVALEEARAVDRLVASGADLSHLPLLGVPFTVKESLAVAGLSNEAGVFRQNGRSAPAAADAVSVQGARAAGAIPLLVSNTPEFCMGYEAYNSVTGTTRNPYDTRRTPGGSSGGEAALIGAGASVMGIGSDIGGSLRLPAMFTGIFGHKPSPGVVSPIGHVPDCRDPDWQKYFTVGPMTRYAEDLPVLLQAIADPNGPPLGLDKQVSLKDVNFFQLDESANCIATNAIGSDVNAAMNKAVHYVEHHLGKTVKKISLPNMRMALEIGFGIVLNIKDVDNLYSDASKPGQLKSIWPELLKYLFCLSNHTVGPVLYGPLHKTFGNMSSDKLKQLLLINQKLQEEFKDILKDNGVLLHPTFPTVAHFHKEIFYKLTNCTYMVIFNTLGFPVTNCPISLTKQGLPVGIQIAANPRQDRLTIAVAQEFEKAFGGWVPPPASNRHCTHI